MNREHANPSASHDGGTKIKIAFTNKVITDSKYAHVNNKHNLYGYMFVM